MSEDTKTPVTSDHYRLLTISHLSPLGPLLRGKRAIYG
jgi:hypothetical protein